MGRIYLVVFGISACVAWLAFQILKFMLGFEKYKAYQSRLNRFKELEKRDAKKKNWLTVLENILQKLFQRGYSKEHICKKERQLRLAGWENKFTGAQYITIEYLCRIGAILLMLWLRKFNAVGIMIYCILFILPTFALHNERKETQKKILEGFPQYESLVEGYLAGKLILPLAMEESLPFLNASWQKLTKNFLLDLNESGRFDYAIDNIISRIEAPAIKDFFSLLQISTDNLKCFEEQGKLISNVLEDQILKSGDRKEVLMTLIQLPLLLCIIAMYLAYYISFIFEMFQSF